MGTESTQGYDLLYEIIRRRSSVRKLKPDPIPDGSIEKILEAGRWAMSGANSQPWEYIVVKDPQVKKDLFRCYSEDNTDFIYWMEQQRVFELRHPAYQMTADEAVERQRRGAGWSEAPALIVVLGDGRRQWGTVQGAHTFGRDQSHLTDGLANTCTFMHLAAVSLGLDDSRSFMMVLSKWEAKGAGQNLPRDRQDWPVNGVSVSAEHDKRFGHADDCLY